MKRSFSALIFFILAGAAFGADMENDSLPIYYLDEIVVTATRYELALKDLSATVSVVTEDDINALNTRTSADALAHLPGVTINKTGTFGRADIDIRGIGDRGRSVMVLIDGRPVKMGLYGCTVTHSLPMNNVARIEVVRGPSSVLYGSDALGGVINIITKKSEQPLEGDVMASYGTFNTQQYRVRAGGIYQKLDVYATGNYQTTDGHVDNSGYDGKDVTGRIGYKITPHINAHVSGKYFDGYKEEPLRATDPDTAVSDVWNDYLRWAVDLTIDGKWSASDLMLKVYRNSGEHEFSDGWHSLDFTNGFMCQGSIDLVAGNKVTLGGDSRRQGGERVDIDSVPWEKNEYGLFVHDEQVVFDRVILSAGIRYHHDEIAGNAIAPHAGCVVHILTGTIIKASVNKGFRSPQINELYLFPPSNTNLKPEVVWNYETGINQRIIPGLHVEATAFLMNGLNLIETVQNQSPPPLYIYDNTGEFEFRGAEIGMIFQYQTMIMAQVYHSYLDPGEKTTGRPMHKTDALIRTSFKNLSMSLNGEYVTDYFAADSSQNPIDDHYVVDTKISYKIFSGFQPFIAVDNITDETYDVYANLPGSAAGLYRMPGRSYTVGLQYAFE
ncbi:TonB-dependent receptor [candidate division WOR-3 bacterium]|nr:TonB-dependent receptor [candidate division WOR-3 bacterium]